MMGDCEQQKVTCRLHAAWANVIDLYHTPQKPALSLPVYRLSNTFELLGLCTFSTSTASALRQGARAAHSVNSASVTLMPGLA